MSCSVFTANAGTLADKASGAGARAESFVEGRDGWRFLPADLRFADKLASPEIVSMVQPAVAAIEDFSRQLKDAGIALVVLPVPPKALVHGVALGIAADEDQKMREGWEKIMAALAAGNVQVVDLLPEYSAANEPMYCRRDTHWSGPGIDAALARLLPFMQAAGIEAKMENNRPMDWKELPIKGDLGGDPETVKVRPRNGQVSGNIDTPVLLLGDSHVLVFHEGGEMHATDAGLPEQIAFALGAMPELIGVRGSGASSARFQLARRVRSQPDFLKGKKIVIWVFAGREFTEADMWKKVPIFPRKAKS